MLENREIRYNARQILNGNWVDGSVLAMVLIFSYIASNTVGYFIVTFVYYLVPLALAWTFLDFVRGGKLKVSELLRPYHTIPWKAIGLPWLSSLYLFLWSLLLIVPAIIKYCAYSQSFFILKDEPHLTCNQVISKSRHMMYGYKWKYFKLGLANSGWLLLCFLTLGVGFLWFIPYLYTQIAIFYEDIKGQYDLKQRTGAAM